jgi:hypothetical protein
MVVKRSSKRIEPVGMAGKSEKRAAAKKSASEKSASSRASGGQVAGGKKSSNKKRAADAAVAQSVLVVNMIPRSLSGEENQDSEPTIAVNPANPLQIAGSAFTPDPGGGPRAPIYISGDGGQTWTLNAIVPSSVQDGSITADITVSFGSSSNILYAGIIRLPFPDDRTRLNILRTKNFQSATAMDVLVDRTGNGVDQPYVQATTMTDGPDKGKDRLYVGDNDFSAPGGKTATIDQSLNAGASAPTFKSVRIESRKTAGQDGPTIRPVIHKDGTVYAILHSWRTFNSRTGKGTADIVVVRDDKGGASTAPFTSLIDPGDGKAGIRVALGTQFNFNGFLGQQRTGGDVSIAVDPNNSSILYIAYNDDQGPIYALHVLRSTDRGQTWSPQLRNIPNALNGALAINNKGTVGFLYQQLTGTGAGQKWVTKLELSRDGATWNPITLAQTPANEPGKIFDPYLGDYDHLMAVGKDFYGIFSANNMPDKANFPQGVVYQRNANFNTRTLLNVDNVTPVHVSIDPFFFKATM